MTTDTTDTTETKNFFRDTLGTPEIKLPPPTPDAHRAQIIELNADHGVNKDSGAPYTAIHVLLQSQDDPNVQEDYAIFVPEAFANDIRLDPTTLDRTSPGINSNTGKPRESAYANYGRVVHNSGNDAQIDRLFTIAEECGTLPQEAPEDFDGFVALLNQALQGQPCVFARRPDQGSEGFRPRLRVSGLYPISAAENPKLFKKVRKAWEEAQGE